jgi:hypothetical protein
MHIVSVIGPNSVLHHATPFCSYHDHHDGTNVQIFYSFYIQKQLQCIACYMYVVFFKDISWKAENILMSCCNSSFGCKVAWMLCQWEPWTASSTRCVVHSKVSSSNTDYFLNLVSQLEGIHFLSVLQNGVCQADRSFLVSDSFHSLVVLLKFAAKNKFVSTVHRPHWVILGVLWDDTKILKNFKIRTFSLCKTCCSSVNFTVSWYVQMHSESPYCFSQWHIPFISVHRTWKSLHHAMNISLWAHKCLSYFVKWDIFVIAMLSL